MNLKRFLLLGLAVVAVTGTIAGAQVGRTPNFGDSFIRDPNLPVQATAVNAQGMVTVADAGGNGPLYSASISGLVVPNSAGADAFVIGGSATKIIRIYRVTYSSRATAVATSDVILVKRSSAPVTGTGTARPIIPWDSASTAGSAVVSAYTVAPTAGTAVGTIKAIQYTYANLTTGTGQVAYAWTFNGQPVTLRSATETLSINLPAGGPSGNLTNIDVEWTESNQ